MITITVPYETTEEAKEYILNWRRIQSSIIRSSYNRAQGCLNKKDIENNLKSKFATDSYLLRCGVLKGVGDCLGDTELGKKKPRIYGSRKSLEQRRQNKITKEEFKLKRLCPLYIEGEANQKGNRKFNFVSEIYVEFKPQRGIKFFLQLQKLRGSHHKLLTRAFELANLKELPITITLKCDKIFFTFDDKQVKSDLDYKPIKNRYAGIDLNPNYIGVSILDDEKVVATQLVDLKSLNENKNTASSNKRTHETFQVAHSIGNWLRSHRVDKVFIESLNFKSGCSDKGRNFNRLVKNNWLINKFKQGLSKYFKLHEINSCYTSTIGNVLYNEYPDPVASSIAIGNRGYNLVICKNKKFYPVLPTTKELTTLWKNYEVPMFKDWIELHSYIKETGISYRVDLPCRSMFSKFQSQKSLCYRSYNFKHK